MKKSQFFLLLSRVLFKKVTPINYLRLAQYLDFAFELFNVTLTRGEFVVRELISLVEQLDFARRQNSLLVNIFVQEIVFPKVLQNFLRKRHLFLLVILLHKASIQLRIVPILRSDEFEVLFCSALLARCLLESYSVCLAVVFLVYSLIQVVVIDLLIVALHI